MSLKNAADDLILMAEIVGAHGVRGAAKLKIFAEDPAALADYPPLCDAKALRSFEIDTLAQHGNIWLATFTGIADRTAVEKLHGTKLYLPRTALPSIAEGETYYHVDLIGLAVETVGGQSLGKIIAVSNFGAGDLLDVKPPKGNSFYIPFTKAIVPHVDIAAGKVTVDPPPGLLD